MAAVSHRASEGEAFGVHIIAYQASQNLPIDASGHVKQKDRLQAK